MSELRDRLQRALGEGLILDRELGGGGETASRLSDVMPAVDRMSAKLRDDAARIVAPTHDAAATPAPARGCD